MQPRSLTCAAAGATTVALALVAAGPAAADRRAFTRTYEYMTMPEGETEVELYSTHSRKTFDGATSPQSFVFQVEIEHGITDRWDVSLYHVFAQASDGAGGGSPLALSEVKLRTRYRFAERGELPVDVLAYGEAIKEFGAGVYAVEGKAILGKDFGKASLAVNLIGELELGPDVPESELELGLAAGLTYEVSPRWKLGAETWLDFEAEEPEELAASAGPALSWAPSSKLWVTATAGFGLTDEANAFSVRGLIGLGL
jgi:hypothetical protein